MNATLPGPAANIEAIRLALQSWPDVEAYLKGCKGIIIPLGSTEQHGPTGAIGTDALTAEAVALELGRRSGVLVTPAQAYGMAEHHLGFAGTMSLQPATLMAVMHDLVLSLATHGFERIFVVNGHGGNMATTKAAFAQAYGTAASRGLPVASKLRCRLSNWFMAGPVMRQARELYGDREGQHATPSEIAVAIGEHGYRIATIGLLPRAHHEGVVDGDAGDFVHALGLELVLELVDRAERLGDRVGQLATRLAAPLRAHGIPVERVVPDLSSVIENTTSRSLNDLF